MVLWMALFAIIFSISTTSASLTAGRVILDASKSNGAVHADIASFKSGSKSNRICAKNTPELSEAIASFCEGTNGTGLTVPSKWSSTSTFSGQGAWHLYVQANACQPYHDYLHWVDKATCKRQFEDLCADMIMRGRYFGVYGVIGCEVWVLSRANVQNMTRTSTARISSSSLAPQRPLGCTQSSGIFSQSNPSALSTSCLAVRRP